MKITFDLFLQILKEAQVRNRRGIDGNFLQDKNIFFQRVKENAQDTNRLPALKDKSMVQARKGSAILFSGCSHNADLMTDLSLIEQYQGNGPLNFFQSLRQSEGHHGSGAAARA